jgi:hypothetical protein
MCNGNDEFNAQFQALIAPGPKTFYDAVVAGTFPNRRLFPAHIPRRLRGVIQKCLQLAPADRYQAALHVANDLAEIEDCLDWRLSNEGDTRTWRKENENRTLFELSLLPDGSTKFYRTPFGGQPRRISDGWRQAVSDRDLRTLLGAY